MLLLLKEGHSWRLICAVMFCSTRTVALWKQRFETGGIRALSGERPGARARGTWTGLIVEWVLRRTPRDFGFVRSRWCCGVIVLLVWRYYATRVSPETVRRRLREAGLVWRRPRPVLRPVDPERKAKLRRIRALLADLPEDQIALFQDEVDINSNPKIGAMWMTRGDQAPVETPGKNEKRYLAGSLNWRTGQLIATEGRPREGRNSALFIRHLEDLCWHLRRYRSIHVICDNASFHHSGPVRNYLERRRSRIVLHFLPTYAPEANPIERVWWHLHEEITRNHQCKTLEELLDLVFHWLETRAPFQVEDQTYGLKDAA
jgi:transposase